MLACMLIRDASVWPGDGPVTDVRITGGRVAEVAPGLRAMPGEEDIEAAGGALLPGLHDHHIHLRALAAARPASRPGRRGCGTPPGWRRALRAPDADAARRRVAALRGLPRVGRRRAGPLGARRAARGPRRSACSTVPARCGW